MLARNPLRCYYSMSHFFLLMTFLQLLIMLCYQTVHLILIVVFFAMNPETSVHVANHFKLFTSLRTSNASIFIWHLIPARTLL